MRWWLPALGLLLGACVSPVSLDERACPCGDGWSCCEATQVCVREALSCPAPEDQPSTSPDAGTDGGTIGGHDAETGGGRDGGVDGGSDGGTGEVDGGDPDLAARCFDEHWCWENPSPHARYYEAVWAAGPEDVWAVGAPGIATHWDGKGWQVYRSATEQTLLAIWGTRSDDVWAVGRLGAVVRWNGKAWQPVGTGLKQHLVAVWGSSPNDVWVGGFDGALLHWNGAEWVRPESTPPHYFTGLWGTGPSDAWVATAEGALLHWDGQAWSQQPRFQTDLVLSLSGADGVLWALDQQVTPATWRVRRFEGGTWTVVYESTESLRSLVALSAREAWAVGAHGRVLRLDDQGAEWSSLGISEDLEHIWGTVNSGLWAVGSRGQAMWRHDGQWISLREGAGTLMLGGRALSPTEAWASGDRGTLLRWSEGRWMTLTTGTEAALNSVWGASSEEVWAVGAGGTIVRSDGTTAAPWPESIAGETLRSIWGSGPADVWAVGDAGRLLHYDGQSWSVRPSPTSAMLYRVWGISARSAWAVGEAGTLLRRDGTGWISVPLDPPPSQTLYGLWGASESDLWAVGARGVVRHYDGQRWSPVVPFAEGDLLDIWGTGPTDIYVLERRPEGMTLFHYDGATWRPEPIPYGGEFNALWGMGMAPRIGGFGGAILRYKP